MNAAPTCYRFLAATTLAILAIQSPAGTPARLPVRPAQGPVKQLAGAKLNGDYGKLPLAFEPNVGQTDARVRFLARGGGMTTFFTDTEAVMVLSRSRRAQEPEKLGKPEPAAGEVEQAVVRMKLEGAGGARRPNGLEKLPGISNYFIGNDPAKWRTDVPRYGRIQYEGVYAGIDLVWYGNQRQLEYDFVVAPGADARQIQVAYEGVESLKVEANGDLVLRTKLGEMRQRKPRVYQEMGGKQVEVGARYAMVAGNRVEFELARYDRKRELRIDPVVLVYSTYLGGSGDDEGYRIAVDGAGSAYVTGQTYSTNFPTQMPYEGTFQGTYNAFVTKLTAAGNAVVYSTYLGGNTEDLGLGIAVDGTGAAYVMGQTYSTNFPTQSAYQATSQGAVDAFVTKLTPAGNALAYSTYLGGTGADYGSGIAVDGSGSAYVTGETTSYNFPLQSAYQTTMRGVQNVFVTKLTPAGSALVYSTYLGGSGGDWSVGVAVDAAGSAYVTGKTTSSNFPTQSPYQATLRGSSDAFVTKLTPAGSALVYSTYLGGSDEDQGYGIAVDGAGSAYITGQTGSADFPTQSAYQGTYQGSTDAFVTKLTPAGDALVYSTYLGGSGSDSGYGIAVDGGGSAYVTGSTASGNFPTQSAYQGTYQGSTDAFVTKLTPSGNALVYSTYLGGSGSDSGYAIAVDGAGAAYVVGYTASSNFPVQSAYQATALGGYDVFVSKLSGPYNASLGIGETHVGNFTQGQNGAIYTVTVSNAGLANTSGTVTVTETVPSGMTLASMSGTGWTCPGTAANNCTRSDVLAAGASYPAITVTVNVASGATSPQVNQVSVSGGGSAPTNTTDSTTIVTAFTDTSASDFFFDAVNLMREYGITAGCGASTYCPNDNVTRAQMAIFMVRSVLGGDNFTYSATPYFNDVPSGAFGFQWIQKMWELGITAGCGVGLYCPNDAVTRGQMAIFVIRARLGVSADSTFTYPGTAYFTDVPASHPYFKWIQRMRLDQITAGCGVGTYCPNDPVTRGQMAIFIMRGSFNLLLPSGTPVLVSCTPATAPIGQATSVTLTGVSTNFVQGTTVVSAGPGITVGTATVTNATTLSVSLTVAGNAAAGPRTLVATTGSEQAVLPNGLMVQ